MRLSIRTLFSYLHKIMDTALNVERFSLLFYSSKSSRYSTFLLRSMLGTTLPL